MVRHLRCVCSGEVIIHKSDTEVRLDGGLTVVKSETMQIGSHFHRCKHEIIYLVILDPALRISSHSAQV